MADPERANIDVGFIPITDCAPIVPAEELGACERQGLEVEICREVSWANGRDELAGRARCFAHPCLSAARADARHRQRQRGGVGCPAVDRLPAGGHGEPLLPHATTSHRPRQRPAPSADDPRA